MSPGGSEHAQRQLFRALRYHTLQDPQLHNTLKDLLALVRTPGKGLSTAARIYLARRESMWGGGGARRFCKNVTLNAQLMRGNKESRRTETLQVFAMCGTNH